MCARHPLFNVDPHTCPFHFPFFKIFPLKNKSRQPQTSSTRFLRIFELFKSKTTTRFVFLSRTTLILVLYCFIHCMLVYFRILDSGFSKTLGFPSSYFQIDLGSFLVCFGLSISINGPRLCLSHLE